MKVLLLIDTTAFAGIERHILDLAVELQAQGAVVEIGCPPTANLAERALAEQIPVMTLSSSGWSFAGAILKLRQQLKTGRWDIVHVHNGRSALLLALARLGYGVEAFVATQHFVTPARQNRTGWKAALGNRVHRWVEGQAHRMLAISEAVKDAIMERGGPAMSRTRVVLNGIQDPQRRRVNSSKTWRAELGLTANAPLIACVSRLEPEKGLITLLEAMTSLVSYFPTAQCLIAGNGSEENYLRRTIDEWGLAESVRLLGFQSEPQALMREADVFVLPSAAEPFGLVIVEAMAMECPVVAVAAGGPLEIVQHGKTGLLVPGRDAAALAEAVRELLTDRARARAMGAAGRLVFLRHFTARAMAEKVLTIYEDALGRRLSYDSDVGQIPTFPPREIPTVQSASRVCR